MAGQQAVDINVKLKNNIIESIMDTSLSLSKRKKLKRLKHQRKLSTVHGSSLNRSGRGNLSFNSTLVRQTLRANNRNLARSLESVRKELKICQLERLEAMRETHELQEKVRTLQRVCGLKNDEIDKEVNLRISEQMAKVKNVILKASQGLQATVPLLMDGLLLCSGSSGRSSSVGSYLSAGESTVRSSTGSRENSPIDQMNTVSKPVNVNRRSIFGVAINEEVDDSSKAERPVRSAIPATLSVPGDLPRGKLQQETAPVTVRPSDFCQSELSMIMEQSHLGDLDVDDLDGISSGRRSSRQRMSRKTKSRGRRSTVQASRSLEMFQQSLAENSENSSQEESSPVAQPKVQSMETDEVNFENDAANNMEADVQAVSKSTYECKLNDVESKEGVDDKDEKIKSSRTRSRSMKRAKSSGRETRSKSKGRKRSPSPESDTDNSTNEKSANGRASRGSSRMSRRDSFEQTIVKKSPVKLNSTRSKSRAKSKKISETEAEIDSIKEHKETEAEVLQKDLPKRKSRRLMDSQEIISMDVDDEESEGLIVKETESTHIVDGKSEGDLTTRRKSRRRIANEDEKVFDDVDAAIENDSVVAVTEPVKKTTRKSTRKSKRLVSEEVVTDSEEIIPDALASSSEDDQLKNVVSSDSSDGLEVVSQKTSVAPEERKSKRKSRRATNALFTADDIDGIMDNIESTGPPVEDNVQTPNTTSACSDKDRRGTFVLDKKPVHSCINNSAQNDNDKKKDRRGTFVVPTAPPPAPRPKKTISNIPMLEGRAKPVQQKEVKKKLDNDRRGTYFVAKPVTPYIDVENIEDIADSILISSTDDESMISAAISKKKEDNSQQKVSKDTCVPEIEGAASQEVQPGEMTVLEPEDMELTEALSVPSINWNRFSAPEPDFLKKVSPGPRRSSVTSDEMNVTVKENLPENTDENQTRDSAVIEESDIEEKQQSKTAKKKSKTPTAENNTKKTIEETSKEVQDEASKDKEGNSQEKPRRSRKFRLMKASDDTLGPSDTESVTTASDIEEQIEQSQAGSRKSRRSTKPVKYTESVSDDEEKEESENEGTKKEKISDLLKAKSRQKYQAWLSKPGDIKFTGGKRDVSSQLIEDLTKHHRSKSKDRSTIIPKPRARSRSRSRSRPRIPLPPSDDSPKGEFDFVSTPPLDRLKQLNKSPSAQRKSDGLSRTPGHMSYSEFRGRTPLRKSVGDQPGGCLNPDAVPLLPKKTNCPEDEEFTMNDHGIMLLLGNGRRTKPRTKGKSVCMAPEKSNVHLITPMVAKTQNMPRTPPPHGQTQADDTPPTENVVLKPPPRAAGTPAAFRKPSSPVTEPEAHEDPMSIPESPMVSPKKPAKTVTTSSAPRRSKSSDRYFGFEVEDEDSVLEVFSPPPKEQSKNDSLGAIKKTGVLSRKSLMEGKPKTPPKQDDRTSSSDTSSNEVMPPKHKHSQKSELSKSVKKRTKLISESDDASSPEKSKRSVQSSRSHSRTMLPSTDKENEMSSESSPIRNLSHKTPKPAKSAKTPAPTKTPAAAKSVKSAKGKSTKKTGKTPGTTKKAGRATLTNLKRKLEVIRSKTSENDNTEHSPNIVGKKSKTNRRLYGDNVDSLAENSDETTSQKRKSEHADSRSETGLNEESSPKRPRRAASKVACYIEPSLGSKLRQGDPGTSTIYQGDLIDEQKSLQRKSKGTSRKRDALHTVTNLKI